MSTANGKTEPAVNLVLQQPPYSEEFERASLGAAINSTKAVEVLLMEVTQREFYAPAHRAVYAAVELLSRNGRPVDVLTVSEEMEKRGWLERVGGNKFLWELSRSAPVAAHIADYAREVAEKALQRDLIDLGGAMTQAAREGADSADDLIARYTQTLLALARRKSRWEVVTAAVGFSEQEQELIARTAPPIMPLRQPDLDAVLKVHPGDLIILAGDTSVGKSATAMNWLTSAAIHEIPSVIVTLEMSRRQCEDRILAAMTDLPLTMIAERRPTDLEIETEISPMESILKALPLRYIDRGVPHVEALRGFLRETAKQNGTRFVVIDQLNQLQTKTNQDSEALRLGHIARMIKAEAMESGLGIVLLHQLNRTSGLADRPNWRMLRGSGMIAEDADAVVLTHRPGRKAAKGKEPDESDLLWIIDKQRNGPTGEVKRRFRRSTQKIFVGDHDWTDDDDPGESGENWHWDR